MLIIIQNGRPHVILKNRLKKAVSFFFGRITESGNPSTYFLLTGGYTTGYAESEAAVMKRWLLDGYSISPDVIFPLDERAQNTVESAYFSKRKLLKSGIDSVS